MGTRELHRQKQEKSDFEFSVESVGYERGSRDQRVQLGDLQTIMVAYLDEISVSSCGGEGGCSEDGFCKYRCVT